MPRALRIGSRVQPCAFCILSAHAASSSLVITSARHLRVDTMMLIYLQSFIIIITIGSGLAHFNPLDKMPPCNYEKVRTDAIAAYVISWFSVGTRGYLAITTNL